MLSPDDSDASAPGSKLQEIPLCLTTWQDGYMCTGCMVGRGAWESFPPMAPVYLVKNSLAHTKSTR